MKLEEGSQQDMFFALEMYGLAIEVLFFSLHFAPLAKGKV